MEIALITGSAGLVGSETTRFFSGKGLRIAGIDNDMRKVFFGPEGSTRWNLETLKKEIPDYKHYAADIRDEKAMEGVFREYGRDIKVIVHAAAQPSHDWAANDPKMDFTVNANGTLILLELARRFCPGAPFIFLSTNKVYGDTPNRLPLVEQETRWEIDSTHPYFKRGIDETMSMDQTRHSLFGASKAAADLLVQEYGRYFGMKTAAFRCGCLTGPDHSGVQLHGFLAYLMKCAATQSEYKIFGYLGKQVRDNIHSRDLASAFYHFYKKPRVGEVYNMGGSRFSNCSMLEAVRLCEKITGHKMKTHYVETPRAGDHIWWISDVSKFQSHYPQWSFTKNLENILADIFESNKKKWLKRG